MIRKTAQHNEAIQLRRRGFTYAEIAKIVGISKGTVSNWLSRETWSETIRNDNAKRAARENSKRISLLNTARGNQHKKLYAEAERFAANEFKHYKANPLFTAGVMLYAAQGDHNSPHLIRLSSARLPTHRIFIRFCLDFLGVPREKIRFLPLLYPSAPLEKTLTSWSKHLDLPLSQFHNPQVIQGATRKTPLRSGVGNTIIGGTVLKRRLTVWVDLATKELSGHG